MSIFFPENFKPTHSIASKSFHSVLEKKLQEGLRFLPQNVHDTLCDPDVARLFHENVAKSLFLSVLTGTIVKPHDVQTLAYETMVNSMENNIPSFIQNAPPKQAARILASWMKTQLAKLDVNKLGLQEYLTKRASELSSDSVAIAKHVLKVQGLGLNWRIDAMKDIGNIDKILALPDNLKTDAMRKEAKFIGSTFDEYTKAIRDVFPKSIIRPEITKLTELVGGQGKSIPEQEQALLKQLMGMGTGTPRFDGITNFSYFNDHYSLIRACGRPDEGSTPLPVLKQVSPPDSSRPRHRAVARE